MLKLSASNNSVELYFRLRNAGTDDSGNNYIDQTLNADSTTVAGGRAQSTGQRLGFMSSTTRKSAVSIEIFSPNQADYTNTISNHQSITSANDPRIFQFSGYHLQQVSYDGFTVFPVAGTITGNISIYGYKK